MPLLYSKLGMHKHLNEIGMAGSHDAAINEGDVNERTQSLDIRHQASAGVRFFDVRINAKLKDGEVEMRAFHGPSVAQGVLTPKKKHTKHLADLDRDQKLTTTNLRAGTWGMELTRILRDAKAFVTSGKYSSEFLILKFDKSTNYRLIAETCMEELRKSLYSAGGNLNTKPLEELAGKVIVVFPPESHNEIYPIYTNVGILNWKNLYKPPSAYDQDFEGLQYWGAGGTKLNNKGFEGKIQENIATQKGILNQAATGVASKTKTKGTFKKKTVVTPGCAAADPNAIGMMYWTTTGVKKSIQERNARMWDDDHIGGLSEIWKSGFRDYMDQALPPNVDMASFSSGGMLKTFMPNIVMIDFSDRDKCQHIYSLNTVAMTKIVKVARKRYDLEFG